jgi:hypothetical protein
MASDVTNHLRPIVLLHELQQKLTLKTENSGTAKTPIAALAISTSPQKQSGTERHDGCHLQTSSSTLRIPKLQSILIREGTSSSTIQTSREHSLKDQIYL